MIRFLRDLFDAWRFRRRYRAAFDEFSKTDVHGLLKELREGTFGVDPSTGRDGSNLRFLDPEKKQQRRDEG